MFSPTRGFGCAAAATSLVALSACAPETIQHHMQEHFAKVSAVKTAVIAGDFESAREPAEWLAEHDAYEALPGDWEPHVAALQEAAQRVAGASDLATAAVATADMGKACGTCHQALNEGAQFTVVSVPTEDSGVVAHMLRHEWAAQRLWEGLIGPSDEAWTRGAETLDELPLRPQGAAPEVTEWANTVHAVGEAAMQAADLDTRAQLYGELLGSCAQCHRALGRGPAQARPFGER